MKASTIMRRALVFGAILTVSIAVLGSIVGLLVAGVPGLLSALIGAGLTALFMGFTAASILLAVRVTKGEPSTTLFFGIILGAWLLKLIVFIVIMLSLRSADFLQPMVLFVSILAAVIGSLAADVIAFIGAREPYVDVELPGPVEDEGPSIRP